MCDRADCPAELEPQSDGSPGVVLQAERLARILYRADQVEYDTGQLKPGAFPVKHLRQGLSLARLSHMSEAELQQHATEFEARNKDNKLAGVGVATTSQVRSLRDSSDRQALCVVDDAKPDFRAHALAALRSPDEDDASLRALREHLIDFFSPAKSIADVYD
jgi:hypothetical protein